MDLPKRTQEGGEAGETRVMQSGFDGGHLEPSPARWQCQGEGHGNDERCRSMNTATVNRRTARVSLIACSCHRRPNPLKAFFRD